ncbi:MAG: hypothetical protein WCF24_04760 [Acidimicrobiales bacterium]
MNDFLRIAEAHVSACSQRFDRLDGTYLLFHDQVPSNFVWRVARSE